MPEEKIKEKEEVIAEQGYYRKHKYSYPHYKLSKVTPQSGSQSVTIVSGGDESIFELPVKNMNFHDSVIEFTAVFAASTNYSWIIADCLSFFRQIQLYTRSGVMICDLNDVNFYTKVVWSYETNFNEYKNYDDITSNNNYSLMYQASNKLADASQRSIATTGTEAAYNSDKHYDEQLYFHVSGNAASYTVKVKFPLGRLVNTIFSLNKNLYFGEILNLRLVWGNKNHMAFDNSTAVDIGNVLDYAGASVAITNLALYLAYDDNPENEQMLRNKILSSGMEILMPYVWRTKTSFSTSGSQNVSIKYNIAHGQRLMKIYHSVFRGVNTGTSAHELYDHANYDTSEVANGNAAAAVSKVQEFYTMIDNERLSNFNIVCPSGLDWLYMKKKCQGTPILSSNIYNYNWAWIDDFSGEKPKSDNHLIPYSYDNLIQGLSLIQEKKWDFQALTRASFNSGGAEGLDHWTFAICQRVLTINRDGIFIL